MKKQDAMNYCHRRAGQTIDGGENRIHFQWIQMEVAIRDDGLEETVENQRTFIRKARNNKDSRHTYDTRVSQEFLGWYDERAD